MVNSNGIPDLGMLKQKPRAASGFMGIVRHLDENGTFEPAAVVQTPNGPMAQAHRSDYLDAEQLLDEMRKLIREELRAFAVRMKMPIPDEEA